MTTHRLRIAVLGAGLMGAVYLSNTASALATLARQGDLDGCKARLPELEQAWSNAAGRLQP